MNRKNSTAFILSALTVISILLFTSLKPTQKMKPGYCLFDNVEITDAAKLEEYKKNVFKVVEKYGGKYVVAGGQLKKIEGDWKPHFLVMIEFPSFEQANKWYDSEEYRELKALRHSSGKFDAIIMEGL